MSEPKTIGSTVVTAEEYKIMTTNTGAGFFVGAGIPQGKRVNTFIECGCCGAYHRTDFQGDCREDSERFAEIPEGGEELFLD